MIGALRGKVLHRSLRGEVTVEVGGIGYRVHMAPTAAHVLGTTGDEVLLWVHHHQREDGSTLYGFAEAVERDAFEVLLGTRGIGPSLALAMLAVHGPTQLAQIVTDRDLDALCLVPGIGKKTAARLLVELQGTFDLPVDLDVLDGEGSVAGGPRALADVRTALAELGYAPDEIREALHDLDDDGDAGELLREALRRLARAG
jgi:Holliday junction DNA helicase RuvA